MLTQIDADADTNNMKVSFETKNAVTKVFSDASNTAMKAPFKANETTAKQSIVICKGCKKHVSLKEPYVLCYHCGHKLK